MSGLKLIIGNKNYSSWSLRPWFFMRQFGIEFDEEIVWLDEDETHQLLRPYQSNFKVPLLADGQHQVWDSLAIIEYVADSHAIVDVWPTDIKARSHARAVAAEMHSSFAALRAAMPMNIRRTINNFQPNEATQKDIHRVQELWRFCRQRYGVDGPWLFGTFSAADAMFAPVVMRFAGFQIKSDDALVQSYQEMVVNHPQMRIWVEAALLETRVILDDEV